MNQEDKELVILALREFESQLPKGVTLWHNSNATFIFDLLGKDTKELKGYAFYLYFNVDTAKEG